LRPPPHAAAVCTPSLHDALPISFSRKSLSAVLLAGALTLSACAGENADAEATETDTLRIDYATYNPLSLIIKDQGWLEDELDGDVEWVYSAGSNKANE